MDNVHVTKSAGAAMAALLIFGAVAAGLIAAPQTAYAAVNITSSDDIFYGPGFIRVLVTDDALDESGDTITPTIEARDGSTIRGSISPDIEAIGSSGQFEIFITTSTSGLSPASPTKLTSPSATFEDGPFIVRLVEGANSGLDADDTPGVNANGDAVTYDGQNNYGLGVPDLEDFDNIRVLYGGQTLVIDFDDSTATLTGDRTEAGEDTEIVLSATDPDANVDPTLVDIFSFAEGATAEAVLNSQDDIDYSAAAPDSDTMRWVETGQNTGVFELTIVVNGAPATQNSLSVTVPIGNSFTLTDQSIYEAVTGAATEFGSVTAESDTSSFSVTLRNRDGAIALTEDATIANGLLVQITDADRNIATDDDDDIAETGEAALLADTSLADSIADLTITGVIVGVDLDADGTIEPASGEAEFFSFTETGDGTGVFVPDYNDDKITVVIGSTSDVDGAAGVITLDTDDIEEDIVVVYKDPAIVTNTSFQIETEIETVQGVLTAETEDVGITDDAVLMLADADLNTDPDTIQTYTVGPTFTFVIGGETVATLAVDAAGEALAAGEIDATFIETGPNTGEFTADDIDMTDVDAAIAGGLDDGDEIEFTYEDLIEDDDSDVTINVGIPDEGIDVDRSTVPIPGDGAGEETFITLSVVDPVENDNPGSVDSVTVALVDISVEDDDGTALDVDDATGITGAVTLTETGPNTGIFEEEIELTSTLDADDLRDAKVTFEYGDESVTVTYRAYDGSISAAPAVVSTGNEFEVRVSDQDGNRDPNEQDTIEVDFETDEDTDDGTLELEETGDNTGVFVETVETGVDIVVAAGGDFSTEITLTYVDAITSSGDTDEDRETTVHVATATGQLVVEPEMVGPGTEITLTLIDTDLNEDPNSSDEVDDADDIVEIDSSDGEQGGIGFEETGPNTGIFEATIQFEPRGADDDGELTVDGDDEFTYTVLPGDVIAFRYEDEESAGGGSTVVSVTFEISSEDPTMEAASPTVQIGGTIALTIEDFDANEDADSLDSVDVEITSDSDPVGFTLSALETGENTGIFTLNVPTSSTVVSGAITVGGGDDVFLEYSDEFPADYADRVDSVLDPSKDFVLVVPVGTSVSTDTSATTPEPVVPKDISGDELDEVTAGQQVVLSTTVNNNRNTDLSYAAVIEVRDADGFTVLLQWATGTLPAGGENEVGLSWTPMEAGEYTVRTFVLSDISNPSALSLIEESTLTVS